MMMGGAQRADKDSTQLENDQINIFRLKAPIVSKQIYLSRLFNPTEKGRWTSVEGLSVKSNSFCAVNVKLWSALQHALNFPPKLACKHPDSYSHPRIPKPTQPVQLRINTHKSLIDTFPG